MGKSIQKYPGQAERRVSLPNTSNADVFTFSVGSPSAVVKSPIKLETSANTKKKEGVNKVKVSLEIIKAGEELTGCGRGRERQLLRGRSHSQLLGGGGEGGDGGGKQNRLGGKCIREGGQGWKTKQHLL